MANEKRWVVEVEGKQYQITFKPNIWTGKHTLKVNGIPTDLKRTKFQSFTGLDQPIMLGNKEARLVMIGRKVDIAIDGVYIDSKKPYLPLKSLRWWSWVFVLACMIIPIISMGGALPAMIGVLGSMYCVKIGVSPYMRTPFKILASFAVIVISWTLFILLVLGIS